MLERATGMSVSQFMATRLWQPLGAEFDASWSLDSEEDAFEKMESGLNVTPVDYARFGLLFLHGGEWNGNRIVSRDWVRSATASRATSGSRRGSTSTSGGSTTNVRRFYALGNFGQYIYIAPDADAVIVRNGRDWGVDNDTWLETFRAMADRLAEDVVTSVTQSMTPVTRRERISVKEFATAGHARRRSTLAATLASHRYRTRTSRSVPSPRCSHSIGCHVSKHSQNSVSA